MSNVEQTMDHGTSLGLFEGIKYMKQDLTWDKTDTVTFLSSI